MTAPATVVIGDTIKLRVPLTLDGVAFEIPSGATVRAAFRRKDLLVGGPWNCSSGATGADWPNGILIVEISIAQSALLSKATRVQLEVEVDDGGEKQTWLSEEALIVTNGTIE